MLILGIDTGGTYTDGVIMERESGRVLHTAKALTTADDLSVGIENCMRGLHFSRWDRIGMVGLSTTLATNAIVEGAGCRVGLILLGKVPEGDIPADIMVQIDAQLNIRGSVRRPLTNRMIDDALSPLKGACDAIAVSGYAGVRNPAHEQMVKRRAVAQLGLPVVCGHEMTGTLGYYERTVTTVLNGRLLYLIRDLLAQVGKVTERFGIRAPIMIVRGDGSLMHADYAVERPVETVLSGPAASVIGARFLSGCDDGAVVDMGGTTTDIAVLHDGECRVSEEGAVLSGWRTRVRALEIFTFGLGGDSEISVSPDRHIQIGPRKVVPLCRSGYVSGRTGLTPTDVLHASGIYRQWPVQRATDGIHVAAIQAGLADEVLTAELYDAVVERLIQCCKEGTVSLAQKQPVLIGVGAPAVSWLTAVAQRLDVVCHVPQHAEVANAIGAAVGQVCETAQVLIRQNRLDNSYYIYTEKERLQASDLQSAKEVARDAARRLALEKADRARAKNPTVTLKEELLTDTKQAFLEWSVTAKATGHPQSADDTLARIKEN